MGREIKMLSAVRLFAVLLIFYAQKLLEYSKKRLLFVIFYMTDINLFSTQKTVENFHIYWYN